MPPLLVFPTLFEASVLIQKMLFKRINHNLFAHPEFGHLLITGPGIPATILSLTQYFTRFGTPDSALHLGIAGTYKYTIELGEVCFVVSDRIADLGVEEANGDVQLLQNMDFVTDSDKDTSTGIFYPNAKNIAFEMLREVKSITVNVASGSEGTILQRCKDFNADIENMETAAFFMCCKFFGCKQYEALRAISNVVEPRNKEHWKIESAINSLTEQTCNYLEFNSR